MHQPPEAPMTQDTERTKFAPQVDTEDNSGDETQEPELRSLSPPHQPPQYLSRHQQEPDHYRNYIYITEQYGIWNLFL